MSILDAARYFEAMGVSEVRLVLDHDPLYYTVDVTRTDPDAPWRWTLDATTARKFRNIAYLAVLSHVRSYGEDRALLDDPAQNWRLTQTPCGEFTSWQVLHTSCRANGLREAS